MSVRDGRIELKQLTLQVYDLISSSLADARTIAASNDASSRTTSAQEPLRAWVASSASLLQQLLEICVHPAGTFDSRQFTNAHSLTTTVDGVGSSLLTLRNDQTESQRSAAARPLLEVQPPSVRALASRILLQLLRGLLEARVPCVLRDGHVHLIFTRELSVRCRLEPEGVSMRVQAPLHPRPGQEMQAQEEDARGRLVLEPVIRTAGDEHTVDRTSGSSGSSSLPPFLPPPPSLAPLMEGWISRLHDRVPPCEAEEGGRVRIDARVKQLAAVYAALSAQCTATLLSHTLNHTLRCWNTHPTSTTALADSAAAQAIVRIQAAGQLMAMQDGSRAVVHAATTRASSAQTSPLPLPLPLLAPPPQAGQGQGRDSLTPGWYAQHVGAGLPPTLLGRMGEVPTAELARVLLACRDASSASDLFSAGPGSSARAVVEADARAYDAATGRSVAASRAVRPLPAPLRTLLTWVCEQRGMSLTLPRAPLASAGAGTGAGTGEAVATQEGGAGDSVAPLANRASAAHAVLRLTHVSSLSPDYQACSVGIEPCLESSHGQGTGKGKGEGMATAAGAGPGQPAIVVLPHVMGGKCRQQLAVSSAEQSCSHALHSGRSEGQRLVAQWSRALLSCRAQPALQGLPVAVVDQGAGQVGLRVHLPAYGISLYACYEEQEGSRLVLQVVGPAPPCITAYMPTHVQKAVQQVAAQVTAQLHTRKAQLSLLLCPTKGMPAASRLLSLSEGEMLASASSLLSTPLQGYCTGVTAGQAIAFYGGLTAPVALSNVISTVGSCSLSSILLQSLAKVRDGTAGSGAEGGAEANTTVSVQGSGLSILGAPLQTGADLLLAASLHLKSAHDAELLSLLTHGLSSSMEEVVQGAKQLGQGAYAKTDTVVHQLIRAVCQGPESSSEDTSALAVGQLGAVQELLATVTDATGWSHSQLYQALTEPTAPSPPVHLSMTHIAIARKFAALHAVALVQGVQDAVHAVQRLWPVQTMAATMASNLKIPAPATNAVCPPLFVQSCTAAPAAPGVGVVGDSHSAQQEVAVAHWAALPMPRQAESESTWEGWLRMCTDSLTLSLCSPLAQCGTVTSCRAGAGAGVGREGDGALGTALHGVMALGVLREEDTDITATPRWATADEVASLGSAASLVSTSTSTSAQPVAGAEDEQAVLLVLQCNADVLRACCHSRELSEHVSQGKGLPPSSLQVTTLLSSLTSLCSRAHAKAVLLLPALTDTAGAIAAIEEGFICSAHSKTPILWATGAAAQLIRRIVSPASTPATQSHRPGAGKVGMFGRTGQAAAVPSTSQPASSVISIKLARPTAGSLLRVLASHRWTLDTSRGASALHGQGQGVKRSRMEFEAGDQPTAAAVLEQWHVWHKALAP